MGYVEDLRKLIGHKRIILNGSVVLKLQKERCVKKRILS